MTTTSVPLAKQVIEHRLRDAHAPQFIIDQVIGGTTFGRGWAPIVYISGPMRGYPGLNFSAFDQARDVLVKEGWTVISPADIDRFADPNHAVADHDSDAACRIYALRDFFALMALRAQQGDRVVTLSGWTESVGGRAEVAIAKWLTIPQIDL